MELPVEAFVVQNTIIAVLKADHTTHLWGVTPHNWQPMDCDWVERDQRELPRNSPEKSQNL